MQKHLITLAFAFGISIVTAGNASADNGPSQKPTQPDKVHSVVTGDSLSEIASQEGMPSWRPLWDANTTLSDPNIVHVGDEITIPSKPVPERPLPAGLDQNVNEYQSQGVTSSAPVRHGSFKTQQAVQPNFGSSSNASGILERVRQRESGGNYATNTGNGYYGAYQFNLGTWRGVGGSGLPSDASPAEQDMRAGLLYSQRGCSPWPNTCR